MDIIDIVVNSMFIKNLITFLTGHFCSLYLYHVTSKLSLSKFYKIALPFYILLTATICSTLKALDFPYYRFIFLIFILVSCIAINPNKPYISFPNAFVSIGISYCIESICILLLSFIYYCFKYFYTNTVTELSLSILQITFTILLSKYKRIKNGFTFFNKNNFGLGLLISGPILVLFSMNKDLIPNRFKVIVTFGLFISISGLFIWIRSAFKRYYRKKLKKRAEEYSKIELAEKDKEIEKLLNENTSLSSIIHLDNHIIQSIENDLKALKSPELTDKLLISLNQRNEYVNNLLIKSKNLASTGNAGVDAVLADLYIKAASRGIDYNLNVGCDINYLLNNIISKDDFEILLRETITNSIVSVENNPDTPGRILINISQPNDIYELTIMDNGINTYDINSISEIIKKSNASILTKDFDDNDSFTNSITVRFDGLNTNTR